MVLALGSPVGANFLKDFPALNSTNLDKIDAYANSCLTTHPLKQYTPQFTSTGTQPTIGTGGPAVLRAYYYEIFDQIYTWGEMRFGTTSPSSGTGIWIMSLPFNVNSNIGGNTTIGAAAVIGTGSIWCNGTAGNRQPVNVHLRTANTIHFSIRVNSGASQREITGNSPIAWAAQDGLSWNARLQRLP